jgi:L-threonylcarbamoyladenylate synthase
MMQGRSWVDFGKMAMIRICVDYNNTKFGVFILLDVEKKLLVKLDVELLNRAIALVHDGGVIIYPTDTVYGIGCDPFNEQAVNRIKTVKNRVKGSMPVLVDQIATAEKLGQFNIQARTLAERFWPGPLTIVVPSKVNIPGITDENNIGLRIPQHEVARCLVAGCEGRLVGTSANISGAPPATRVDAIPQQLRSKVDMVIDGGESGQNASTVVTVHGDTVIVTRIGEIPKEEIIQAVTRGSRI